MLNRRRFLKLLTAASAIALIPRQLLLPIKPRFYPMMEYGVAIPLTFKNTALNTRQIDPFILKYLHASASKILPQETLYEIRRTIPSLYDRYEKIAWYYHPYMKEQSDFNVLGSGHILVGQYKAKEVSNESKS